MFTTKRVNRICILFILIMNHYAKKEISRYKRLLLLYVYNAKTTKMMSGYDSKHTWRMHLNPQSPSIPYLQYLIVYAAYITFGKDGPLKQK